eukprot:TRINITY_DN2335_c0_g1_i1.p1 TRINITY_DN2335_c0_g1~~TRINITY_DN2335_c0_g1_i1.p1  ORF type:complete len:156 (-),score=30.74 TRINITY_DN2335_c0_g1_i1:56-523(-)
MEINIRKKLKILKFPGANEFLLKDFTHLANAVFFLESEHVRDLKPNERAALRTPNKQWEASFRNYMKELDCPCLDQHVDKLLLYLLHIAIEYQIEDEDDSYGSVEELLEQAQVMRNKCIANGLSDSMESNSFAANIEHLSLKKFPAVFKSKGLLH